MQRRGDAKAAGAEERGDTLVLRFPRGTTEATSPALAVGVYEVRAPGGTSLLVVNRGLEWVPRRPTVQSGPVGGGASVGDAPALRQYAWPFVVAVVLLCAEWFLRRRAGLR